MSNPRHIIKALGPDAYDAISARIGRSARSVMNQAAGDGAQFPASWYAQIKALCDERGVECPLEAFAFAAPDRAAS